MTKHSRLLRRSLAGAALIITAGAAPAAAQAPFTLAPELSFGADARVQGVTLGDFDSDGHQDLAVTDANNDRVQIRRGKGDGTFVGGQTITNSVEARAIASGDFDGDGDEDLVVAARLPLGHGVATLRNSGNGGFEAFTDVPVPGNFATSVASADLDADGRADVVAVAPSQDTVSVRLGQPNGTVAAGADYKISGKPHRVTLGDVNGDGIQDITLSVTLASGPRLGVMIGLGGGGFGPLTDSVIPGPAMGVALADFNADARLDAATALPDADKVHIALRDVAGSKDVAAGDEPVALVAGDFDGDGDADLAIANRAGDRVGLLTGNGAGDFVREGDIVVGDGPNDLVAGDFDEDGTADLAVAEDFSGTVSVLLGTSPPAQTGNLLTNGGFERGLEGWTATGAPTTVRYGINGFLPWRDAPLFSGQSRLLSGGDSAATNGTTSVTQLVDLDGAGRATVALSAWLGGALHYGDTMEVRARQLDASGKALGTLTLSGPGPLQRRRLTTLLRREADAPLDRCTTRIEVTVTSTDNDRFSSAMADNVRLALTGQAPAGSCGPTGPTGPQPTPTATPETPEPTPTATPTPTPVTDSTAPVLSGVRLRPRGVAFRLSEQAAVAVKVSSRRRTVKLRHAGAPGANRVVVGRLPAGRYRVVLRATDAAGNRATARTRAVRR